MTTFDHGPRAGAGFYPGIHPSRTSYGALSLQNNSDAASTPTSIDAPTSTLSPSHNPYSPPSAPLADVDSSSIDYASIRPLEILAKRGRRRIFAFWGYILFAYFPLYILLQHFTFPLLPSLLGFHSLLGLALVAALFFLPFHLILPFVFFYRMKFEWASNKYGPAKPTESAIVIFGVALLFVESFICYLDDLFILIKWFHN